MIGEITEEKRKLMNELYHQAIYLRRAQLEFKEDGGSSYKLKKLEDEGDRLHDLLTKINGGKDPIGFISSVSSICETASMLAREGGV